METLKNIFAEDNLVLLEKTTIVIGVVICALIIEKIC